MKFVCVVLLAATVFISCTNEPACFGYFCEPENKQALSASAEGESHVIKGGYLAIFEESGITEALYQDSEGMGSLFEHSQPSECSNDILEAMFIGTATITVFGEAGGYLRVCGR